MKIAIDGQVFFEEQKTGIGWLAHNVICNLKKQKQDQIQLNCFTMGGNHKRQCLVDIYKKNGIYIKKIPWFHGGIYARIWNKIQIPYWLFFGNETDITLFFNYIIPPGVKGKTVAFVHDMAYKVFPETIRKETKVSLDAALERTCQNADRIITISQFSKSEIIKYMGVNEEKIHVISLGIDTKYYHSDHTQSEIENVKKKYGLAQDYFFYQGTIEPRKNLKRLIQAYGKMQGKGENIPELVLAGKKGWLYDEIFEEVNKLHLNNVVKFLGYIDLEDISKLMRGAVAFVYPSLYEGFGLPPLEAMASGAPVITSNVASLPEVVGDAGILVDPMNVDQIAEAMLYLAENKKMQGVLSEKGIERAKKFRWEDSAQQVIEIIRQMKYN